MDLQKNLFDTLKPLIPKGQTLADYIGSILYLSSDSVYRRLRGETQLSLDELKSICQHFGISADKLINLRKENQIICERGSIGNGPQDFTRFIEGLYKEMLLTTQFPNAQIFYSGKDIPFFDNLLFPSLFAFKYHIWMQLFAMSPDYMNKHFEPEIKDASLLSTAQKAHRLYNSIPSIEIWNSENINGLLFQIEFCRHSKYFESTGQIAALYHEVDELLWRIEKQADAGCKFLPNENPENKPGNYKLFFNQVSISDNIILIRSGDRHKAFINYSVTNFLITYDRDFCEETESYLNNIIRRSTQISQENIKMRSRFFNQQHEKVDLYRKNL